MNEIELKQAKKQADKKAIKFIVALFILYILFSQGNLFMNSVMSHGARFYNVYIAQHFNYIQGLRTALIVPSVWLIKSFGFFAIHNAVDILIVDGPYMRINYSCLGLGVMSFLAAFLIAFPTNIKSKIKMLIFSFLVVYLLNVLRIAGLGIFLAYFKSQRKYFEYHHEIYNIIVYIVIFIMLYFWMRRNRILPKLNNF